MNFSVVLVVFVFSILPDGSLAFIPTQNKKGTRSDKLVDQISRSNINKLISFCKLIYPDLIAQFRGQTGQRLRKMCKNNGDVLPLLQTKNHLRLSGHVSGHRKQSQSSGKFLFCGRLTTAGLCF